MTRLWVVKVKRLLTRIRTLHTGLSVFNHSAHIAESAGVLPFYTDERSYLLLPQAEYFHILQSDYLHIPITGIVSGLPRLV